MNLLQAVERHLPAGYTIRSQLGTGATSWVYLAERDGAAADDGAGGASAPLVVKVMHPGHATPESVRRFKREMLILQKLEHPRIVPILQPGEVEGSMFFTMPYRAGGTLRARLMAAGAMPVADALAVARDLADALGHAHGRGVVHRDVKPENIVIDAAGAHLIDFGFASAPSLMSEEATAHEARLVVGTPDYVSPEELTGRQAGDWRSDFYSLGCVLYEMLTGRPPFPGSSSRTGVMRRVNAEPPDPRDARPDVPDAVAAIVRKNLAPSPNDRYATAGFLCMALDGAIERLAPLEGAGATG